MDDSLSTPCLTNHDYDLVLTELMLLGYQS